MRPPLVQIPDNVESGQCYDSAIGVGDKLEAPKVVDFALDFKFRQIVQSTGDAQAHELKTAELMLSTPDVFIRHPVSSILDPMNACAQRERELRHLSMAFVHSNEKKDLLESVRSKIIELSNSEALASDIVLGADELFTNAVFNAPYVNYQTNGPGAPRTLEFGTSSSLLPAEIFVGAVGDRIILGCADSYGSLNPDHLLRRLKDCFDNGASQSMNMGQGGAGLGTMLLFQTANALYVGVSVGQRTVVCCSYIMKRRARERAAIPKNLHLCAGTAELKGNE